LQPFLVGFLHIASLYFIFYYFFFLEKKRILGNHPKLGDDSEQIKILNSSFAFAILS
jgi:hypothetical protein